MQVFFSLVVFFRPLFYFQSSYMRTFILCGVRDILSPPAGEKFTWFYFSGFLCICVLVFLEAGRYRRRAVFTSDDQSTSSSAR